MSIDDWVICFLKLMIEFLNLMIESSVLKICSYVSKASCLIAAFHKTSRNNRAL